MAGFLDMKLTQALPGGVPDPGNPRPRRVSGAFRWLDARITWTSTANAGPSGLAVRKPAPLGPAGSRPPLAVDVMPCIFVKRRCETRRRCVFSALMGSVLLGMRVAILPLAAETEVVPPRSFRRSTRSSVKGGPVPALS